MLHNVSAVASIVERFSWNLDAQDWRRGCRLMARPHWQRSGAARPEWVETGSFMCPHWINFYEVCWIGFLLYKFFHLSSPSKRKKSFAFNFSRVGPPSMPVSRYFRPFVPARRQDRRSLITEPTGRPVSLLPSFNLFSSYPPMSSQLTKKNYKSAP